MIKEKVDKMMDFDYSYEAQGNFCARVDRFRCTQPPAPRPMYMHVTSCTLCVPQTKANIGRGGGGGIGDDTRPVDSSEEDSGEEDDDIADDDANGDERGEEENDNDSEEDETSSEPDDDDDDVGDDDNGDSDDNDEFEHELRAVAAAANSTTTDKAAVDGRTPQRDEKDRGDDGQAAAAAATTDKEVRSLDSRQLLSWLCWSSSRLQQQQQQKKHQPSPPERIWKKMTLALAATVYSSARASSALRRSTKRRYAENRLNGLESSEDVQWLMRPPQSTQKLLSKRQSGSSNEDAGNPLKLIKDLKEYLLIQYAAEREKLDELSAEELLATENVFQVLAKLSENPERWERIHQLLMDVKADVVDYPSEAKKRLVGVFDGEFAEPLMAPATTTMRTPTTSPPAASEERPTRKARKKKKKKKRLRKQKLLRKFTSPVEPLLAPTDSPPTKWRSLTADVMAKQGTWSQEDGREDVVVPGSIAKIRYTVPATMRGWPEFRQGGGDDKEQDSLRALNSERQALMLKAAREFDYEAAGERERTLHYGKISTHPKGLFGNDDGKFDDNDDDDGSSGGRRAYHFGQVVSHGGDSGYERQRPREQLSLSYPGQRHQQQQQQQQQERFNANFGHNQGYLPPGRQQQQQHEAGGGGSWAANAPWRGYDRAWSEDDETAGGGGEIEEEEKPKNSWNWRPKSRDEFESSWLQQPWNNEHRDYYARLEDREGELDRDWRQRQQSWERQSTREKYPDRPRENEMSRLIQRPGAWPNREKSKEYASIREKSPERQEEEEEENNGAKSAPNGSNGDDSKDSPKLTLKTWDSLTSDPATWPFKLPGAKPWPKDKNGVAYNPNAAIVRKLGLITDKQQSSKDAKDSRKQNDKSFKNAWDEASSSSGNNNNNNNNSDSKTWQQQQQQQQQQQSSEKIGEDWKSAAKWKQFAYHKVTQPGGSLAAGFDSNNNNGNSSSSSSSKLSNKNAFIAVSAVAKPRYNGVDNDDWRKNDIEEMEIEQNNNNNDNSNNRAALDLDHPSNQMRMIIRKKNVAPGRPDALENQLEKLKTSGEPVLLTINH
ncbi:unnamed protein product [Trichogramma brassicae]|uniref:Uncharacterized protein n=1 Tax=Trichogramma brassicae TaxID=86971 RepID=A0A6H5J4D4_9HYME|nr:unnamed protein product [Trichogramma brassicae]